MTILRTLALVALIACTDSAGGDAPPDATPIDAAPDACLCMRADNDLDTACALRALGLEHGVCVQLRCPQDDGAVWRAQVCAPELAR